MTVTNRAPRRGQTWGRGPGERREKSAVMSESLSMGTVGTTARDRTHTLLGQTMGYVAATTGFFALGAYVGRHLSAGWAIVWFIFLLIRLPARYTLVPYTALPIAST